MSNRARVYVNAQLRFEEGWCQIQLRLCKIKFGGRGGGVKGSGRAIASLALHFDSRNTAFLKGARC